MNYYIIDCFLGLFLNDCVFFFFFSWMLIIKVLFLIVFFYLVFFSYGLRIDVLNGVGKYGKDY